ncbi:hypothetical protein SPRG_14996 [Saprolegnia parasitica CBS 223.65]|uniref:Secreted protein n=1 Tax=Saprolegnia parasitica (strain CBS 223.65) TaxID=695850 RepID=A0A067BZ15_SAPPC|nr:hypothetical protein SPRG_14996 [Saprolegnia parasitica CBS 223.65]KDO19802.1 hypothetical protein SPRG_14996 [Saprolegnia parasitica CBS 223.65]|eukprot:XP_012209509.1 hypothetical protein SPRG_14996 [Saprolegnia parasitica CBS 223.65]
MGALRLVLGLVVAVALAADLPRCQSDQFYGNYFASIQSHPSLLPCMRAANMTDRIFLQMTLLAPTRAQVAAFFASADCEKVFNEVTRVYREVFPASCAFNADGLDIKALGALTFDQLKRAMLNATIAL